MEELKKVRRVIGNRCRGPARGAAGARRRYRQNAISQAKYFNQSVELTGLALTSDGTAKGGVIFAPGQQRSLPIRFIGVAKASTTCALSKRSLRQGSVRRARRP